MLIQEFEDLIWKHSLRDDLLYNSNAFAGEAGEVCNAVKKIEMAKERPDWIMQSDISLPSTEQLHDNLDDELGDALFYLVRTAHMNGTSLTDLFKVQARKLAAQSEKYGHTFLK